MTNSERIQANNEQLRESIELANSLPDVKSDYAMKYLEDRHAQVSLPTATRLKKRAFYNDPVVTDVSIPNVTLIDGSCFYECDKLETINMPKIRTVETSAFEGCDALSFPNGFPESLYIICDRAFAKLPLLEQVTLPAGIFWIKEQAFLGCANLRTVTFKGKPGNEIHSNAFGGCYALTTINVPWAQGEVANAPWGATNATINYNYSPLMALEYADGTWVLSENQDDYGLPNQNDEVTLHFPNGFTSNGRTFHSISLYIGVGYDIYFDKYTDNEVCVYDMGRPSWTVPGPELDINYATIVIPSGTRWDDITVSDDGSAGDDEVNLHDDIVAVVKAWFINNATYMEE